MKEQTTQLELNEAQARAVKHKDGPLLVVAGAGTGKTSVIVERINRLIDSGIDKSSILALTFTEKAAQEMLDRVAERLFDSYGAELNIFTFNGFGQQLLQEHAIEIGLSPNLRLVGDIGKVVLLREHLDELGLDYFAPVSSPDGQLASIADYFSLLKQQLVAPNDYAEHAQNLPSSDEAEKLEKQRHSELASAFGSYIAICRRRNVVDYDDQIYLLVQLLETRPNILQKLQKRYSHILVDEFQDTNPMQSRLLDLLAGEKQNIMVVGDDDQSIYGWRGATLSNILSFSERYRNTKEVTLLQNYRSTQAILDSAYRLIQNNNPNRLEVINKLDKKLQARAGQGKQPLLKGFTLIDVELDWVARDIEKRIAAGADPGSIAVLARRSAGVSRMHEALDVREVPHTVVGVSASLYDHPMVETMIQALRAVVDPRNVTALHHALTSALFNCDTQTVSHIASVATKQFKPFDEAASDVDDKKLAAALQAIAKWREIAPKTSVGQLAYTIIDETGLKDSVVENAERSEVDHEAAQALFQWFSTLRSFEAVSELSSTIGYLENLAALRSEDEALDDGSALISNDRPVVMTVHKAKGLEWEVVYNIDCTENSFPLRRRSSSLQLPDELTKLSAADDHYNEERRLMYVAVTRAKRELIVSYSESHNGSTKRKPSRFIDEMFGELAVSIEGDPAQTALGLFDIPAGSTGSGLPAKLFSGDKLVLSASQANDYFRCPLDFKYRHILGVPAEPSPQAAIGTLYHGVMQMINDSLLRGVTLPKLEDLSDEVEENWPQEGFLSAEQRSRSLKAALASLKTTYQRVIDGPTPVSVEEPFRVHIPDAKLILKGRLDVVLPLKYGVEIRDYKTSTNATSAEKAKRSTQASKQLEMYALAWRIKHGEYPVAVSLDFVQTNQIGSVKKKPATIDGLEDKLKDMAEKIRKAEFKPGYSHDHCRHPEVS